MSTVLGKHGDVQTESTGDHGGLYTLDISVIRWFTELNFEEMSLICSSTSLNLLDTRKSMAAIALKRKNCQPRGFP